MLTCKPGVQFHAFPPAMLHMLSVLGAAAGWSGLVPPTGLVITSAYDGQHAANSKHYKGEALDVRAHDFADAERLHAFRAELEETLGPQFTVLLEDEGGENEHLHLQVKKGTMFSG